MKQSDSNVEPIMVNALQRPPVKVRRGRAERTRKPRLWTRRMALTVLAASLAIAVVFRFAEWVWSPIRASYRIRQEVGQLETRRKQLQARHDHLKGQVVYLNTVAGVEEEARRQGWVRTGEVSVQILTPPPPEKDPKAEKAKGAGFIQSCMAFFTGGK